MPNNTNFQTFHQMGTAINEFVKQATGRDNVQNIDIDHVTVAQNHYYEDVDVSGIIASFMASASVPLDSCIVQIEPIQSGSGDPAPDNVRPITGWTGAKVQRTGKNLLPMPITSGSYANTVTVTVNDDLSFYITKTNASGWTQFLLGTFTLKAGTYTLIESDDASQNASMSVVNTSTGTEITNTRYNSRRVFTLEEDTEVRITFSRSALASNVLTKLMLFFGDTATAEDYEPYKGQTYSISWQTEAGTVYHGHVDLVTGELVVDMVMVDLGTLTWTADLNRPAVKYTSSIQNLILRSSPWANALCSHYTLNKTGPDGLTNGQFSTINSYGGGNVFFKDSAFEGKTSVEVKEYLSGVQLVYELAEPQTYQLTPTEILTLQNQINNIWADTGSIEVKFTDIKELY